MQEVIAVVLASLLLFPPGSFAQESKASAVPTVDQGAVAAVAAEQQPLIVEVFGAWLLHTDNVDTDDPQTEIDEDKGFMGWNAGATLGNRWLGLTTSVAQTYLDVRAEPDSVGNGSGFNVAAKIKLVGIDRGASAHADCCLGAGRQRQAQAECYRQQCAHTNTVHLSSFSSYV